MCPVGIVSSRENDSRESVRSGMCSVGKVSSRKIVQSGNSPVGKIDPVGIVSSREFGVLPKKRFFIMENFCMNQQRYEFSRIFYSTLYIYDVFNKYYHKPVFNKFFI